MVEFSSSQSIEPKKYNVPKPSPAYYPSKGSKVYANKDLYKSIHESSKTLVSKHRCEKRNGLAVKIPAKSIIRLTTPEGPQVCDLNIWNQHDKRERLWISRTAQLHSYHVSTYDRLWSNLPFLRPLVTITGDSLGPRRDEWGGRIHDCLGTRCDPYVDRLLSGEHNDDHCHSNLYRAIKPFGLDEFDVHDVLNVFQVTGLSEESDQYFMETCPSTSQDYFEMFAEIDLLIGISACPGGDLSMWEFGETDDTKSKMEDCCRPLEIEIYKIDDETEVLKDWEAPKCVDYKGNHGLKD
ncbi:hypothetical protein KGF54_000587 [Candida jiufengensis]|uniref:uncharacterized protein n=1 Tax=Candida jiufengensis TaxID=497108 RepID=UPI0022246040|nr:uncharacterized protein KGF54_000587 [Candida jiufengensis]KAI5956968.1 hypothetical protein KGF54_000587 [Candida jiufengensis]